MDYRDWSNGSDDRLPVRRRSASRRDAGRQGARARWDSDFPVSGPSGDTGRHGYDESGDPGASDSGVHTFGRHGHADDTRGGRRHRADDEPGPWSRSTPGYGGRRRAPDDDGTGQWERLTDTGQYVRTATTGDWNRLTDSGVHERDPLTDSGVRSIKWDRLSDTGSLSMDDEVAQDRFDAFWTGHRLAGDDPRWVPTPSSAPRSPAITSYPERRRPDEPLPRRDSKALPWRDVEPGDRPDDSEAPSASAWRVAEPSAPAWREPDPPRRHRADDEGYRWSGADSPDAPEAPLWPDDRWSDESTGRRAGDLERHPAPGPRPHAMDAGPRGLTDTGSRMRAVDAGPRGTGPRALSDTASRRLTDTASRRLTDTGARRLTDTGAGRLSETDPGWGTDPGRRRAPDYGRVPHPRAGATPVSVRRTAPVPARRRPTEELEAETTSLATVLLYTVMWYTLPVLGFVIWLFTLDATVPAGCVSDPSGGGCDSDRAHAVASLLDGVPLFGLALGTSLVFAFILRWLGRGWRAGSIGLAAAIVGGGLSAVLYSAISGQPIG